MGDGAVRQGKSVIIAYGLSMPHRTLPPTLRPPPSTLYPTMQTLYISQQDCTICLQKETLLIKRDKTILTKLQLPLIEQILMFGNSQITTQLIRACLYRNIPIAYLSRMGYCYGRLLTLERSYRHLAHHQQALTVDVRLFAARQIVQAKLKNCRTLLQRQQRRHDTQSLTPTINRLRHLADQTSRADRLDQLMGIEGAGAAAYFPALGTCLSHPSITLTTRTRRPPKDPANAILSFGYQLLWNHILSLIELQGLDPYIGCLHQGSDRHAALASDLIEEFRAPIVDSLLLQLLNTRAIDPITDFTHQDGACYLSDSGRSKYLQAFLHRMEDPLQTADAPQPRWHLLNQQVKAYRDFVYNPIQGYQPYLIR